MLQIRNVAGSNELAETVALCRPEVVAAPEGLSRLASASASGTGPRSYTATAGEGMLSMVEALYTAAGQGVPIVMTVTMDDHRDAMSQRDSGWIQLYVESNQEALDVHVQAFRLSEELSLPVMVCVDGSARGHMDECVDVPTQEQVDEFLPPFEPRRFLDPSEPPAIGAMPGPEACSEAKYLMHEKQMRALAAISDIAREFAGTFGRDSGGLVRGYRVEDAEIVIVALGSVLGTIEDVVDDLRDEGVRIGALAVRCFRPYPLDEVRTALARAKRVVVVEKAFAVGVGGIVGQNVRLALSGLEIEVDDVVAGLGGRPITTASLHRLFTDAIHGRLGRLTFLDMNWELVHRELERTAIFRRSGRQRAVSRAGVESTR